MGELIRYFCSRSRTPLMTR